MALQILSDHEFSTTMLFYSVLSIPLKMNINISLRGLDTIQNHIPPVLQRLSSNNANLLFSPPKHLLAFFAHVVLLRFLVMLLPTGFGVFPPNHKLVKMGAVCCLQSCPSVWHRAACSRHWYLWVKWVDTWGSVLRITDIYLFLNTEADINILVH